MTQPFTSQLTGNYQYSYPTFVDKPQYICIHFITPDQQAAFVSYPNHPSRKAAQLIPLSWFQSVTMRKLRGQPQLMPFLEGILTGWIEKHGPELVPDSSVSNEFGSYNTDHLLAA